MFRMFRYGGVAAAAMILAVVAGWLFLMDSTAGPAFSQVIQNVKNAKSVTLVIEIPTIIQGTKPGTLRQKIYIQGDVLRMEVPSAQEGATVPADAPPILMTLIYDFKQKKVLQLDYVGKTAKIITADDDKMWQAMAKSIADPRKQLGELKDKDAERIGEEDLDGVKTQVYRLQGGGTAIFLGGKLEKDQTAKLWVDPKSGLPVRVAVGDPKGDPKLDRQFIVFKDFHWNEALDPELFKLDVPKGFTVKDK
jgi:outer membrane lipoprotein-sorting protein